ncbi:hypothetical protein EJ06DRAFT_552263 [Trichodelitschia bisporula]|uniref:Zn(2)-C6 fungal-type domain-containing protein n=1 Tax=Trichodelitschia bisporula TaxID=703511 RepID=A0A6G1HID8_9PEZI|nr:hypothetical protein EJ06DRAFT_552263 [Trichodelitschia bisporula]
MRASHHHPSRVEKSQPRRPRVAQACNFCRAKKYRCDGNLPCSWCKRNELECEFQGRGEGVIYSIRYICQLEMKLKRAEAALQHASPGPTDTAETTGRVRTDSLSPLDGAPRGQEADDEDAATEPEEIMDIAIVKRRVTFEYFGSPSALSFLSLLRKPAPPGPSIFPPGAVPALGGINWAAYRSLVGNFHNNDFLTQRENPPPPVEQAGEAEYYAFDAYTFIDAFFNTVHYMCPVLEKDFHLIRCHDLWEGRHTRLPTGFHALYFAVLSLGALMRPREQGNVNGKSRFEWSRLLFARAESALGRIGATQDLDTIHALLVLGVIAANELALNLAYAYLGCAVRTALAMGLNRHPRFQQRDFPRETPRGIISRTWWTVYAFEHDLALTLGRPHACGRDAWHVRPLPPGHAEEVRIVGASVPLARIMERVFSLYASGPKPVARLAASREIDAELRAWCAGVPEGIRPDMGSGAAGGTGPGTGTLTEAPWQRLQGVILKIRYLHTRIVLFHPFLLLAQRAPSPPEPGIAAAAVTALEAATALITTLHDAYRAHAFFRTWWYTTLHLTLSLTLLLHPPPSAPTQCHQPYIDMALDLLDALDSSPVTRKLAAYARAAAAQARALQAQEGEWTVPAEAQSAAAQFLELQSLMAPTAGEGELEGEERGFWGGELRFSLRPNGQPK